MKNDGSAPKQSRREFAKQVTAAVVSIPVVSHLAHSQDRVPTRTVCCNTAACPGGEKTEDNHIPPTVISDGSFAVELKHAIKRRQQQGPMPRPHIYFADVTSNGEQYGGIIKVYVVTEFEANFTMQKFNFDASTNPQLKIWFLDNPDADIPTDTDSDVLVRGNAPLASSFLRTLEIQMKQRKLGTERNIKKKRREKKFKHDDSENRVFRIGKWELVQSNGNSFPNVLGDTAKTSGATGYKFMLFFGH